MRPLQKRQKRQRTWPGPALQLLIGEHSYGKYRWVIKDLKIKAQYFDVHGNQYCTRVSVNLLEYLNQDF